MRKKIAQGAKTNPKGVYNYVNSKTKMKVGVPNLLKSSDNDGTNLTENDKEKAEVLADFFSSVFTREKDGDWVLPEKN